MGLKEEYIGISLALELDDVDCSLSTLEHRALALSEIEAEAGDEKVAEWTKEINGILADPNTTCSSGAKYGLRR